MEKIDKRYIRLKATKFFADRYGVDLITARMCHHETIELIVDFYIKMTNEIR
jgi:hypothetical protein